MLQSEIVVNSTHIQDRSRHRQAQVNINIWGRIHFFLWKACNMQSAICNRSGWACQQSFSWETSSTFYNSRPLVWFNKNMWCFYFILLFDAALALPLPFLFKLCNARHARRVLVIKDNQIGFYWIGGRGKIPQKCRAGHSSCISVGLWYTYDIYAKQCNVMCDLFTGAAFPLTYQEIHVMYLKIKH